MDTTTLNEFKANAVKYGQFIMAGNMEQAQTQLDKISGYFPKIDFKDKQTAEEYLSLLNSSNDFIRLWAASVVNRIKPAATKRTYLELSKKGEPLKTIAKNNLMFWEYNRIQHLQKVVNEGSVMWKIDSIQKFCYVFAAKKYLEKEGFKFPDLGDTCLIDFYAEAQKILAEQGIESVAELNLEFLFKTCETFGWFAGIYEFTLDELLETVNYLETIYREKIMETYK